MRRTRERRLLALEAGAFAALALASGADLVRAAGGLGRVEAALASSLRREAELRVRRAREGESRAGCPEPPAPGPEAHDAEDCLALARDQAALGGLRGLRFSLAAGLGAAGGAEGAVEVEVAGPAGAVASALAAVEAEAPPWRVATLELRRRGVAGSVEASVRFRAGGPRPLGPGPDPAAVAALFGPPTGAEEALRAGGVDPLRMADAGRETRDAAPARRIGYVGRVGEGSGELRVFKDLDSGRLVSLAASAAGEDAAAREVAGGWRLAGRDGSLWLVEAEGRTYRVPEP